MTYTYTNDFHGTTTSSKYNPDELYNALWDRDRGYVSPGRDQLALAAAGRIRRTLCGVDSCTCGDDLGTRPSRYWR